MLPNSTFQSYKKYSDELNSTQQPIVELELSGSERSRRLIPYMAFYLPPSVLSVNQHYSIQKQQQKQFSTNSTQHQPPFTAIESAGLLPPPGYISIPTPQKPSTTGGTEETLTYNVQQQKQPRYRNENQYTTSDGSVQPLLHLLPPGSYGDSSKGSPIFGEPLTQIKQKTVQHFPPFNHQNEAITHGRAQQKQSQQFQDHPIIFRQHAKSQKISLTPFTSSNTVPGHFIPIVYAPLANSDNANNINVKTINYSYGETLDERPQKQQYDIPYRELQPNQQQHIGELIPLPLSMDTSSKVQDEHFLYKQQQPHIQQAQINFIAIAGATGISSSSSTEKTISTELGPAYHVTEISSLTKLSSDSPKHELKLQKLQFPPSKHPHFHAPQPEDFFENKKFEYMEPQQNIHRPQKFQLQPHQKHLNMDDLTPQEKYVLYLRQRLNKNKQQSQQKQTQHAQTISNDRQPILPAQYEEYQQSLKSQANPDIFIYSTMAAPVDSEYVSLRQTHHYRPAIGFNEKKYLHRIPLDPHIIYLKPKTAILNNHQSTLKPSTKPLQQVLHIPVQTLLSEIDSLSKSQLIKKAHSQRYHDNQSSKNINLYGNVNPQHTNDMVEEPKQELNYHEQKVNSVSPPQAAYIIITTAKPQNQVDQPTQENLSYHFSTQRPIYQHPPTQGLQSTTNEDAKYAFAAKHPMLVLPSTTPKPFKHFSITQPYEVKYATATPNHSQITTSPTLATKIGPEIKYEGNLKAPTSTQDNTRPPQNYEPENQSQLPDVNTSSLSDILHKLQANNYLPQTLTADNIDNSIKTLIAILNNLKKTQKIESNPPHHHKMPPILTDDYSSNNYDDINDREHNLTVGAPPPSTQTNKYPGPSTGRAGIDYPNYSVIPQTSFDCSQQRYKGFFGDPETNCQVWHYCDLNGGKASFLCPNGTIFSQIALTCDWWFNVKCSTTPQLYVLNERLYKYILPFNPKFPEDYSGPLVDKYLAMKFQEMEEKMRLEKENAALKTIQEENNIYDTTLSYESSTISTEITRQKIDEQSSERNLLTDDIPEDLAQKSIGDAHESLTKQTVTTKYNYENEPISLIVKPIVVAPSTVEPLYRDEIHSADEKHKIGQTVNDSKEHENLQRSLNDKKVITKQNQVTIDPRKISVEKVEIIEIKSDGTSGHITPDMPM